MKKTRKLAALFLAMVLAFSLMAVTAAAYEAEDGHAHTECGDEAVMPRMPLIGPPCPYCGCDMVQRFVPYSENGGG